MNVNASVIRMKKLCDESQKLLDEVGGEDLEYLNGFFKERLRLRERFNQMLSKIEGVYDYEQQIGIEIRNLDEFTNIEKGLKNHPTINNNVFVHCTNYLKLPNLLCQNWQF